MTKYRLTFWFNGQNSKGADSCNKKLKPRHTGAGRYPVQVEWQ